MNHYHQGWCHLVHGVWIEEGTISSTNGDGRSGHWYVKKKKKETKRKTNLDTGKN